MLGEKVQNICVAAVAILSLIASAARADMVTLSAAKDATIYAESGDKANGQGEFNVFGRTAGREGTTLRRLLLQFDLPIGNGQNEIPAGSTITNVSLMITIQRVNSAFPHSYGLFELEESWQEGPTDPEPDDAKGGAAQSGDVTWSHSDYDTVTWTPGGAIATNADDTQIIPDVGTATFSSAFMVSTVQDWLDGTVGNHGWLIKAQDESAAASTRLVASRDANSGAPELVIEFDPVGNGDSSVSQLKNTYRQP